MFQAIDSPYLVPFDGRFDLPAAATAPPADATRKNGQKKRLKSSIAQLSDLQRRLYAHDRFAVLLIFQAMDAAGKDGTIRAVMSGINPAGCQVYSFKKPSAEELDHDFLWRTARCLPERGRIGIFNRSYYEEVLAVRVHPEILAGQQLPWAPDPARVWGERFESIRDHEKHLARSGMVILKFWLNVSRDEQRQRLLKRTQDPARHWKFSSADVAVRARWDDYMRAYREALQATSRPWAPWYAIPADSKPFMRAAVADVLVRTLDSLGLRYPTLPDEERARLAEMEALLSGGDA